jgi:hypothetical protein
MGVYPQLSRTVAEDGGTRQEGIPIMPLALLLRSQIVECHLGA